MILALLIIALGVVAYRRVMKELETRHKQLINIEVLLMRCMGNLEVLLLGKKAEEKSDTIKPKDD